MKYRTLPFGYQMQDGIILVRESESIIVRKIYADYIAGAGLQEIATILTRNKTEYMECKTEWNKNRIKRLLEDRRYVGDDIYPKIINEEVFQRANETRENRTQIENRKVTVENKKLLKSIICAECGAQLQHRTDNRLKNSEIWFCGPEKCKIVHRLPISDLIDEVKNILNQIILHPTVLDTYKTEEYEPSLEIIRIENEIERKLESIDFDKEEIQRLIYACASAKYSENNSTKHITERLKADFERMSLLSAYSPEVFDTAVKKVLMDKNGNVSLMLKNNEIITKE